MTRPEIGGISPFFIAQDVAGAFAFDRDRLGFEVTFQGFGDDLFFGIVRRGGAMIMFKDVGVDPLPNYRREPGARWDAYMYVPEPDALAAEFASCNVEFSEPLKDTDDGLRGFELKDSDGYVLFFWSPSAVGRDPSGPPTAVGGAPSGRLGVPSNEGKAGLRFSEPTTSRIRVESEPDYRDG